MCTRTCVCVSEWVCKLIYWLQNVNKTRMLYVFFWVTPRCLNFLRRSFETLCPFHLHGRVGTYPPIKMEQSVPKRGHIKFRCREITQKKAYKIQNTVKVWNQENQESLPSWLCTETYQKNEVPVNAVQVYRSTPLGSEQTFTTKVQIAALVMSQVHLLNILYERHSMAVTLNWTQIKYFSFYCIIYRVFF
jgi:hypothetical protein